MYRVFKIQICEKKKLHINRVIEQQHYLLCKNCPIKSIGKRLNDAFSYCRKYFFLNQNKKNLKDDLQRSIKSVSKVT